MTDYAQSIGKQMNVAASRVAAAIELIDAGNTLPFIARYRKEATGSLDDEQLRELSDLLERLRNLDKRRETILASIEEQDQLTDALRGQIMAAETMTELEDLYQPYRPKRRTRALMAREKGLQGLADLILAQPYDRQRPEEAAQAYLNDEVESADDALAGARDIVAETISENAQIRGQVRGKALRWALIRSQKIKDADDPKATYQTYYEFEYRVDRIQPYQVLAINRGEAEKVLRVSVDIAERD